MECNTCVYKNLRVQCKPRKIRNILLLYIYGCYDAFPEPKNSSTLEIYMYVCYCGIEMYDVQLRLHWYFINDTSSDIILYADAQLLIVQNIILAHTTQFLDKERRSLWPQTNVLYVERGFYDLKSRLVWTQYWENWDYDKMNQNIKIAIIIKEFLLFLLCEPWF